MRKRKKVTYSRVAAFPISLGHVFQVRRGVPDGGDPPIDFGMAALAAQPIILPVVLADFAPAFSGGSKLAEGPFIGGL